MKYLNIALNAFELIGAVVYWILVMSLKILRSFFIGFIALGLIGSGPVGWILLYLWDRDVQDRKQRGVRSVS